MNRGCLGLLLLAACAGAPRPEPPRESPPVRPPSVAASRDFDGDGVVDPHDRCPRVAGFYGLLGCPRDSDGDGVEDDIDACPRLPGPPGVDCPDSDGDRVLDPQDACSQQAETYNGFSDADGCPDEYPADLAAITGVLPDVGFGLNQSEFTPSSRRTLDRVARVLRKYPDVHVEISGHVDGTVVIMYSRDLSADRAATVRRYLVEAGVDPRRIESRGGGSDEPIATNKTAAGRAKNRRIELTILSAY